MPRYRRRHAIPRCLHLFASAVCFWKNCQPSRCLFPSKILRSPMPRNSPRWHSFRRFLRVGRLQAHRTFRRAGLCLALRDGWLALALFPFAVVSAPGRSSPVSAAASALYATAWCNVNLHVNAAELGSEPTVDRADDQGPFRLMFWWSVRLCATPSLAGPPRPLALSVKSVQRCLFEALSPASSRWDDFVARLGLA